VVEAADGERHEGSSGSLPNLSITFRSAELDPRELCALGRGSSGSCQWDGSPRRASVPDADDQPGTGQGTQLP
jgi:hypothetical protein